MDFKSEMREKLKQLYNEGFYDGTDKKVKDRDLPIDSAPSSLLALIEKRLPKEKDMKIGLLRDEEKIGFNQCLSEIRKELGI